MNNVRPLEGQIQIQMNEGLEFDICKFNSTLSIRTKFRSLTFLEKSLECGECSF